MKKNKHNEDMKAIGRVHGWEGSVDFPMSDETRLAKHRTARLAHPITTVGLTAALIGAPILGYFATGSILGPAIANAATFELEIKGNDREDYEEEIAEQSIPEPVTNSNDIAMNALEPVTDDEDWDVFQVKRLKYEVSEGGIIESAENIIVEPEQHTLRFVDSSKDGKLAFKADVGYELLSADIEGTPVVVEGNLLIIPAGSRGTLRVMFSVIPQEVTEPQATADTTEIAEGSYQSDAYNRSYGDANYGSDGGYDGGYNGGDGGGYADDGGSQEYYEDSSYQEEYQEEQPYQEQYYEEPSYQAPPATSGTAGMSGDELAMAQEIFNCYNDWRASQGLNRTQWDGTCCDMAMGSARGCAERHKLVHRLGIPYDQQLSYSDILQYASWRMSGNEAVERWSNSSGHAAQMRCPTAQNAAVAVYQDSGIYWFAIVYTFDGTNIG